MMLLCKYVHNSVCVCVYIYIQRERERERERERDVRTCRIHYYTASGTHRFRSSRTLGPGHANEVLTAATTNDDSNTSHTTNKPYIILYCIMLYYTILCSIDGL